MKIGFPVSRKAPGNELEFDLSLHSSKYFGVFDSSDQSIKILTIESINNETQGIDLIRFIVNENISNIISPQFHSMAARFFSNNNIGIYQAKNKDVMENINLFQQNELLPFGAESEIKKMACSASCSSCSSSCSEPIQDVIAI